MENLIEFAEKHRTFLSRVFAVLLLPFILFNGADSLPSYNFAFEMIGIFLVGVCSFGRLWSSMYICGNKIDTLVDMGPYSMVRNPLYFFSFLGIIGIGFISKSVIVFFSVILFFAAYYPLVMLSEEKILMQKHGAAYLDYAKRVPRFFPDFSLLKEPAVYSVHTVIYRKAMLEAIWFIWGIIPLKILETLHTKGVLPHYF